MHPLKDQREGVKYGRGVKYGVTPGHNLAEFEKTFTVQEICEEYIFLSGCKCEHLFHYNLC